MKASIALGVLTILTTICSNCFASPNISLDIEGEIYPGDTLRIPVDYLSPQVPYKLSCSLLDMNNTNNKVIVRIGVDIPSTYLSPFSVALNSKQLSGGY